jgi:hypothetical protein
MSFLAVFFLVFCVLYFIGGPLFGAQDLPYMKRPDDKRIRMPVGSWFRGR